MREEIFIALVLCEYFMFTVRLYKAQSLKQEMSK